MHTIFLTVPGLGRVKIHHHADWSGDAEVRYDLPPAFAGGRERERVVMVPGAILKSLAAVVAADELERMLARAIATWRAEAA